MAIIHRSDIVATGEVLGNALLMSTTAAELYADYEARVVADGGAVADPPSAQAAIQAAIDGGYYLSTNFAVAARWGRKLSGSDIVKLYSLIGSCDIAMTGVVANDTATFAYPTAHFTTNGAYGTSDEILVAKGDAYALFVAAAPIGSNPFYGSAAGASVSDYPFTVAIRADPGVTNASVRDQAGTLLASSSMVAAALNSSVGVHIDLEANSFVLVENGIEKSVQTLAAAAVDARLLTRAFVLNGVAGTPVSTTKTGVNPHRMAEAWALHTSTLATAKALSAHQGIRYQ